MTKHRFEFRGVAGLILLITHCQTTRNGRGANSGESPWDTTELAERWTRRLEEPLAPKRLHLDADIP
jgi:hypothetical protein